MCKKRKKNKKKKLKKLSQFVKLHITGTLEAIRSNLECGVLKLEGVSTAKIVLFHQGSTELWRCKNCIFVLPVNILTGVVRQLLGQHNTLPCVLILSSIRDYRKSRETREVAYTCTLSSGYLITV